MNFFFFYCYIFCKKRFPSTYISAQRGNRARPLLKITFGDKIWKAFRSNTVTILSKLVNFFITLERRRDWPNFLANFLLVLLRNWPANSICSNANFHFGLNRIWHLVFTINPARWESKLFFTSQHHRFALGTCTLRKSNWWRYCLALHMWRNCRPCPFILLYFTSHKA